MSNVNYKPLFSGGGGGSNIIFTTSTDKPLIGEEGKLYLFTDENQVYWWDKTTNTYKSLGTPGGGRESQQGGTVDTFPMPGIEGVVYKDSNGIKYMWSPTAGNGWVENGSLMYVPPQESGGAIVEDGIPYIETQSTEQAQLPTIYVNKNGVKRVGSVTTYLYEYTNNPLNYNPNKLQIAARAGGIFVLIPSVRNYNGLAPIPARINNAMGTNSYISISGSYIQVA